MSLSDLSGRPLLVLNYIFCHCSLLLSDAPDKKRHEVCPGQTPQQDGESTQHRHHLIGFFIYVMSFILPSFESLYIPNSLERIHDSDAVV